MKPLHRIFLYAAFICILITFSRKTTGQQLSIVSVKVKCETTSGSKDGSITIKVKDAKLPVIYGISRAFKIVRLDTVNSLKHKIKGLERGKYKVLVRDSTIPKDSAIFYKNNPVVVGVSSANK